MLRPTKSLAIRMPCSQAQHTAGRYVVLHARQSGWQGSSVVSAPGPYGRSTSCAASSTRKSSSGSISSVDESATNGASTSNGASVGSATQQKRQDFKGAIRMDPPETEAEVCVFEESSDGSVTMNCMPIVEAKAFPALQGGTVGDVLSKTTTAEAGSSAALPAEPPSIVTQALNVNLGSRLSSGTHASTSGSSSSTPTPVMASKVGEVSMITSYEEDAAIRKLRPQGIKGSIDAEDTPEGLTDVEISSVAPNYEWFKNKDDLTTLFYSVVTGGVVATSVFIFDVSIEYIHDLPDIFSTYLGIGGGRAVGFPLWGDINVPFRCVMPIGAGIAVAWLQSQGFSPALKVLTRAMESVTDDNSKAQMPKSYGQVIRKAAASAITLGSGASLGPEAPSVELGANMAAVLAPKDLSKRKQRMLVAAGAAAGVSAAFDAPVSGALFAVEFVLKSSRLGLDRLSTATVFVGTSVAAGVVGFLRAKGQALGIAGAGTHLVGRIPYFSVQPNLLVDVAQFSALGLGCAVVAVALYEGVRVSEIALRPLPRYLSAPVAGLLCGIIAYKFPQVQYGYVNVEDLFRDSTSMNADDLAALLLAKVLATSVCVGGGLVGGLFAPSLFLGALVGDIVGVYFAASWGLVDPTSLVVVGAAAVLGAACRAPLTAIALMVEITRDVGLLVPLLAAIGVASLFTDYLEGIFSNKLESMLMELYFKEKALFWSAGVGASAAETKTTAPKTVESVMGTKAKLYVRHTLPLAQAKAAMMAKDSAAAVVVNDDFSPMGVVFLEDIESELLRLQMLNERDSNFNRQ